MPKSRVLNNIIFVDLATTAAEENAVRKIDGLAAGEFVSMSGRKVEFKPAEFSQYVANTQRVIESTRAESGEIVGLPIDEDAHDHRGGAGWIVGLEQDAGRGIIRLAVKWTKTGADLIGGNIRRFFSPSVDLEQKVILGGSLTNSPASRDAQHRMMLRPVELSANIQAFQMSDSLGAKIAEVCDEFCGQFGSDDAMYTPNAGDRYFRVFGYPQAPEVYDDYLVAQSYDGDDLYKVGYAMADTGEITFQNRPDWVGLKITYKEQPKMSENVVEQASLAASIKEGFEKLFNLLQTPQKPPAQQPANMSAPVAEELLTPGVQAELERMAEARAEVKLAIAARKTRVEDFATKLVGGEKGSGYGLAVPRQKVVATLLSLPDVQQDEVMALLEATLKGVVDFREKGHGHDFTDNRSPVPAQYVPYLKDWVKAGKTAAEFFAVNPEIGAAETFDLSAYEPKGK